MTRLKNFATDLILPAALFAAVLITGMAIGDGDGQRWLEFWQAPVFAASIVALPSLAMMLALRKV